VSDVTECNDGVDNDGDGYIDWQYDLGCYGAGDVTERALARDQENGWTTFDVGAESRVVYVSSSQGDDDNDGLSPENAVRTIAKGASLIRNNQHDFLLLKRGDAWEENGVGRFVNGRDAEHPAVISTYGDSTRRPIIRSSEEFIDLGGQVRNYVAVMGLELVYLPGDPSSPNFSADGEGGIRLVGATEGYLFEDMKVTYGKINVQGWNNEGTAYMRGVEIRRSTIELSYTGGSCDDPGARRPSGSYSDHVDGFLIEDNIYDHNGWNEDVEGACATMFNHNMYLNARRATVRNNIITRGSSMGIKLSAFAAGEGDRPIEDFAIDNNFIYDGEIGVSAGGNGVGPYRFSNMRITNNVFSHVGRSNPTGRNFAWYLDLTDHNDSLVEGNYFLSQPWYTNAYGIKIGEDGTDRHNTHNQLVVRNNLFYGLRGPEIIVISKPTYGSVSVQQNTIVDTQFASCLIDHRGAFDKIAYANNRYLGTGSNWFCIDGAQRTLSQWQSASGEQSPSTFSQTFVDPDRTLDTYAQSLGYDDAEEYLDAAKKRSRLNWDDAFTAEAINAYIKAGFATE